MKARNGSPRDLKPHGLTHERFEALLGQLDADRERAGRRYEVIRLKLVRLFGWRGCGDPEGLADETFNRVSRRLTEGVELRPGDPYAYFWGVADRVHKEDVRRTLRENRAIESAEWPPTACWPEGTEPADRRLDCLRGCLERLAVKQRELVLKYHRGEDNIQNRRALAGEMQIPLNALRIRVHRVRRRLETCVQECLRS